MNEVNFCYWLQGFFEMTESSTLNTHQIKMIKQHLNLVFDKKVQDTSDVSDELGKILEDNQLFVISTHNKLSKMQSEGLRITC